MGLKEQQQQFAQKLQQKMDPALANRLLKPKEELENLTQERATPSAPPKNLDPVLQKRWNAMQERQAAGEDTAKSIDDRLETLAKSRQDKPQTELAQRLAKRG